ncbi:MAG: zinc dependent phospholipase C family protein [Treponema sp.]|nr:zinc dependent phospholipase C family protein [Treponema sp.]
MPAQILHSLFGEDVISAVCRRIGDGPNGRRLEPLAVAISENLFRNYRDIFTLGCQGPDIFYHSQRTRPVAIEYGSLLHRRDFGVFGAELLKMAFPGLAPEGERGNITGTSAYALGFITHAALDRFCHPYIVYRSFDPNAERGSLRESGIAHPFFERILDVLMLKKLRSLETESWDQERLLAETCENPPPGLKDCIAAALRAGFPERAGKDGKLRQRIDNAFVDCAHYYRVSAPARTRTGSRSALSNTTDGDSGDSSFLRNLRFLALVYPENVSTEIDFLNLEHRHWQYPYRPPNSAVPDSGCSFPEIYAAAVEAASGSFRPFIEQYLDAGILPFDKAAESIGSGSLSIQDENGKPAAPNTGSPLPLGDELRRQAEMRGIGIV